MAPAGKGRDDGHVPTAAWAWRAMVGRFFRFGLLDRCSDAQQLAGERHGVLVRRTGEQAVMPDAMEAARQDVDQKAADELVRRQRHDLLAFGPVAAIILVSERHTPLVEGNDPLVRYGDAVSVAREIGEHRLRPGERRFGVDHPALFADRREMTQECAPIGEPDQLT